MERPGDEDRNPTAMQAAINDELMEATRKFGASRREMQSVDAADPVAAYETFRSLGARSDLLRIVGSIGDSLSDKNVLNMLHEWNTLDP